MRRPWLRDVAVAAALITGAVTLQQCATGETPPPQRETSTSAVVIEVQTYDEAAQWCSDNTSNRGEWMDCINAALRAFYGPRAQYFWKA